MMLFQVLGSKFRNSKNVFYDVITSVLYCGDILSWGCVCFGDVSFVRDVLAVGMFLLCDYSRTPAPGGWGLAKLNTFLRFTIVLPFFLAICPSCPLRVQAYLGLLEITLFCRNLLRCWQFSAIRLFL